jgi:hypothetical protein
MPRYAIAVDLPKGSSIRVLEAALKKHGVLPEGANVSVTKNNPPVSRAERLNAAISQVEDAKTDMEDLKQELEDWQGSIPENLQNGEKYSQLEEAISALDELINNCDSVVSDAGNVEFPSMMG